MADVDGWLLLGFGGQAVFMGRFVIQWLASERDRRSVIPVSFWYLSICGALVLLVYAVQRRDPVFVAGQGLGVAIYLRNLQLIRRSAHGEQGDLGGQHEQHGAHRPVEPDEARAQPREHGARREQQRDEREPQQRLGDEQRPARCAV